MLRYEHMSIKKKITKKHEVKYHNYNHFDSEKEEKISKIENRLILEENDSNDIYHEICQSNVKKQVEHSQLEIKNLFLDDKNQNMDEEVQFNSEEDDTYQENENSYLY